MRVSERDWDETWRGCVHEILEALLDENDREATRAAASAPYPARMASTGVRREARRAG